MGQRQRFVISQALVCKILLSLYSISFKTTELSVHTCLNFFNGLFYDIKKHKVSWALSCTVEGAYPRYLVLRLE